MADYSNSLLDFYRYLSPVDNFGKFAIDQRLGITANVGSKPPATNAAAKIKSSIIENSTPGNVLVDVKNKTGPAPKGNENLSPNGELFVQAIRGNYNVVFQAQKNEASEILYGVYFASRTDKFVQIAAATPSSSVTFTGRPELGREPEPQRMTQFEPELVNPVEEVDDIVRRSRVPLIGGKFREPTEQDRRMAERSRDLQIQKRDATIARNKAAAAAFKPQPFSPAPIPPQPSPQPSDNGPTLRAPKNYYAEVCAPDLGREPPVDFSVILLRAPMLSRATNNTDLIQLYLTAMPPVFANQLVPYCDVEFQLPTLDMPGASVIRKPGDPPPPPPDESKSINRPSLYRFLVGSGQEMGALTEADRSIASTSPPNLARGKTFVKSNHTQTFFGMEMFTTPQTLVNMSTLGAKTTSDSISGARLNDAKPFLPLATINSVGISISNAGAGFEGKRNCSIQMLIHDKKRLAEIADFVRGSAGHAEATVWITYGMLASRGHGANDAYAKLINENMLTREAYVVSNTQFSLTTGGGVEVTLTLGAKGGRRIETTTINFGKLDSIKEKISELMKRIKEDSAAFGGDRPEKSGFSKKEIRMAQFISSAASGIIPNTDEDIKEFADVVYETKKELEKHLDRGPDFKLSLAKKLIDDLAEALKESTITLKEEGTSFAKKLKNLDNLHDPFFPLSAKNEVVNHLDAGSSLGIDKGFIAKAISQEADGKFKYFDKDLCNAVNRADHVSLGAIFNQLCIPSYLLAMDNEFSVMNQPSGAPCPVEVQFIFYQLNNHCGPVSCHNIAEFPIDIALFTDGFEKFIVNSGGDNITLESMFKFINGQIQDPRQPGYARSTFYKPFKAGPNINAKDRNLEVTQAKEKDDEFSKDLDEWSKKYGGHFVTPSLVFELEVGYCPLDEDGKPPATDSKDLLLKLAGRIGAGYTDSAYLPREGSKTIVKLHIYDKTCSPFDEVTKSLRLADDGTYYLMTSAYDLPKNKEFLEVLNKAASRLPSQITHDAGSKEYKQDGVTVAIDIGKGKEALMDYLGQVVPRIVIGTEGTLISGIGLQSKTDSLQGTIALQGGTIRRESSLATTGLSQNQYNSPLVLYPAQLTMTTLGCTLAAMGQNFFIDFGTNTTLDNAYAVTSVTHTFSPGKFDTAWTLCYTDGYGRMITDNSITEVLNKMKEDLKETPQQSALLAAQLRPAPRPRAPKPVAPTAVAATPTPPPPEPPLPPDLKDAIAGLSG